MKLIFLLLPIGYLWLVLVNHLRVEWTVNPQYSYGWFVPFLCLALAFWRWRGSNIDGHGETEGARAGGAVLANHVACAAFALISLLLLPTRVIMVADPAWRLGGGLLAFEVVGLTLCLVYSAGGAGALRRYAFPICFFLVAVPWPYPLEKVIIERLTFAASATTAEVLGALGVPAMASGKVIEVSTGTVGVDEACSGIRSFQSSLMLALLIGDLFRLPIRRRVWLIPAGWVLAFGLNVCRTTLLTWVAAQKGVQAVSEYHDFAGIFISVACMAALVGVAALVRKRVTSGPLVAKPEEGGQSAQGRGAAPAGGTAPSAVGNAVPSGTRSAIGDQQFLVTRVRPWLIGLLCWVAMVEAGVNVWRLSGEAVGAQRTLWSIAWPEGNPTFQCSEPTTTSQKMLRYDDGSQATWEETDGTKWHVFYFNWLPGKVGSYLAASRHTPEICMTYIGWQLVSGPEPLMVRVKNLHLPFRKYVFAKGGTKLSVFHCHWDESQELNPASIEQQGPEGFRRGMRGLRGLLSGRGKAGQKVIELVIEGKNDPQEAQAALVPQLERLIRVESLGAPARNTSLP
jgi:exosortase